MDKHAFEKLVGQVCAKNGLTARRVAASQDDLGLAMVDVGLDLPGDEVTASLTARTAEVIARDLSRLFGDSIRAGYYEPEFGDGIPEGTALVQFDCFSFGLGKIPDISVPSMPPTATEERLLAFWKDSPEVLGFISSYCVGAAPCGTVASRDGDVVFSTGDKSWFYRLRAVGADIRAEATENPLDLLDPDAVLTELAVCREPREAFEAVCRHQGWEIGAAPRPR